MNLSPIRPASARVVATRDGRISLLWRHRVAVVYLVLAASICVTVVLSVTLGDYTVSPVDVPRALAGTGERLDVYFVRQVRLPRVLTGIAVGAGLGAAGAVFQSLSRNPLGSPDVIGFTGGAATGAVVVILVLGSTMAYVSLGAIVGGLATAGLVYLLTIKNGVQGYRLVLVGIGASALLAAARDYLITRAELTQAISAQIWMLGSLNNRTWTQVLAVTACTVVLLPVIVALAPRLRLMEMGDDAARALGVPIQLTQALAIVAASALTGAAIAVAGPIGFVALAAPQLARRLVRADGMTVGGAALMGALLLTLSDLLAQYAVPTAEMPVGVMTAVLGGLYLVWLLYREWRGSRA